MKPENVNKLRSSIVGKKVSYVEANGGHGMVLTIHFEDGTYIDICTYDDGSMKHDRDEFYVALNNKEL